MKRSHEALEMHHGLLLDLKGSANGKVVKDDRLMHLIQISLVSSVATPHISVQIEYNHFSHLSKQAKPVHMCTHAY